MKENFGNLKVKFKEFWNLKLPFPAIVGTSNQMFLSEVQDKFLKYVSRSEGDFKISSNEWS